MFQCWHNFGCTTVYEWALSWKVFILISGMFNILTVLVFALAADVIHTWKDSSERAICLLTSNVKQLCFPLKVCVRWLNISAYLLNILQDKSITILLSWQLKYIALKTHIISKLWIQTYYVSGTISERHRRWFLIAWRSNKTFFKKNPPWTR